VRVGEAYRRVLKWTTYETALGISQCRVNPEVRVSQKFVSEIVVSQRMLAHM
jgi:hypothetical protein